MARILVTGANRGIGLALVRGLLAAGDRVIAACRKPAQAQELTRLALAHPGHLHVLPLDLARPASIAELAREVDLVGDRLDGLVNNAGVLVEGERFGALEARAWVETLQTNAVGPVLLTQALAPRFGAGARVMNLSSSLGSLAGCERFGTPSYATSKAALNMATRQLAHALAPQGVIVVAVNPGWVCTDMGGPRAELEVGPAAAALLALFARLEAGHSGRFLDADGSDHPW